MPIHFQSFTLPADSQQYILTRLARKIGAIEQLQNFFTQAAAYAGCKEATAAKLVELNALLDTAEAKLIEAIAAQAAD